VALLAAVLAIFAMVGREMLHLLRLLAEGTDIEMLLVILSVLDLVLVANLLVMVAISSYESFISRISVSDASNNPEWLGKLDSGNVKLKVALSVVMISAIHLLRAFMMDSSSEKLLVLGGTHLVFVLSTVGIALVDRWHRADH
jgi:uncharacterized protein (TIGR00645 family)